MDPSPSLPTGTDETPPAAGPDRGLAAEPPRQATPSARAAWRLPRIRFDRRMVVAVAIGLLVVGVAWAGTGYRYQPYIDRPTALWGKMPAGDVELKQLTARLDRRSRELTSAVRAAAPRGVYIVIDQTQNRLYLKRDDETLLEAKCSAGSGMVLKETVGKKRQWVFDSPRGQFEVLSLLRNPVWAKPDWAFVEDGEPIPKNPADRLESGSLGEYALYFGNGFMIHGTLYERLLGRAVSHGCIRVGRDDLRKVWANARVGMRIYIY
ncbi:MAG: L,D-transpeptidase family protein [Acidobacteria bacterium]|nr:L,D-transpeptidase family protein [Acidobacteriota bacterium]